jgi:hypothetical protein
MTTHRRILKSLHQTTVNLTQIEDYLFGNSNYKELGAEINADPDIAMVLGFADGFEWTVRRYLAKEYKTFHAVNRMIRIILKCHDQFGRELITFSLGQVEDTILEYEWYELMPALHKARQHIQKTFGI